MSYAQDRKVIANVTNVEGFRSFDLDTVTGYAKGADTSVKMADLSLVAYLLRSGDIIAKVTDEKVGFKGATGNFDQICQRIAAEANSNVWTKWAKGDLSKTLQVLCHYVKVDTVLTATPVELWQSLKDAVQVMDSEHDGLAISGVYRVLFLKEKDGDKGRTPKGFAELAATAIRAGKGAGMSNLEMLAAFEALLGE